MYIQTSTKEQVTNIMKSSKFNSIIYIIYILIQNLIQIYII